MSDLIPDSVVLKVIDGAEAGTELKITNKTITIGRDETCELILSDPHVSLKQCQVVFRGGHFTVIDLGSLNKTRVNNQIFTQKNLTNDDIIAVGKTKLLFSWDQETA